MENVTISEPDYWGVLVQWVLFFGFCAILVLPAFLYKNLALKYNKRKWLYFFLGLAVGVIGLNVVHIFARIVNKFSSPFLSESDRYFWLVLMYVVGYVFVWAAYRLMVAYLIKEKNQNTDK